jgi:predicted dehydrogenase/threonine dehydrogenase-like Zn-dependent dehydrogenase
VKQLAQYQDGRLELQEVPVPVAPPGGVLVRVTHSVISAGTERMKVEQAKMNLLQKARARPDQVRKVLDTARNLGWKAALEKVRNRLETPTPLGYSAAGVVAAVDAGHTRFRVGDRVAVGGAECAFHAEHVAVPDLLTARVPEGVDGAQAAYTTIASIALQAVRQLAPTLGERVLVIGQGLVGLLVTALLRAHGARVMALDLAATREPFAQKMGAEHFVLPGRQGLADEVRLWTDGFGVDAAVLATATSSNAPTEQAIEALRDRGRIVVVGNTHVELPWKTTYEKELEVRYSRSYGPGRYDAAYEWGGADYPVGYVRWTEQRNFDACLHLMRTGRLPVDALTTRRVAFADCLGVYRDLLGEGGAREVGVVIEYGESSKFSVSSVQPAAAVPLKTENLKLKTPVGRLDVIGAGNFARTMLLPHLQGKIPFGAIVNATALSANHVKAKFGFAAAATDVAAVLGSVGPVSNRSTDFPSVPAASGAKEDGGRVANPSHSGVGPVCNRSTDCSGKSATPPAATGAEVNPSGFGAETDGGRVANPSHSGVGPVSNRSTDSPSASVAGGAETDGGRVANPFHGAVLIGTRHHLHAPLVLQALAAGRHVFVEKPLCLTEEELAAIDAAVTASAGSVQVGFNRRFAPATAELQRLLAAAPGPKTISFRVMAGRLDPAHWYANHAESGGRVLGEACHFFDLFCALLGRPVRVAAQTAWPATGRLPFPDTVAAQVEFADGSAAQLIYSAEGDSTWPKEVATVFGAGFVAEIENFQKLTVHRGRKPARQTYHGKGHAEQMAAWAAFLRGEAAHPFPYAEARRSMALTFAALRAIREGRAVEVEG